MLYWDSISSIKRVIQSLQDNKLILGTTDTILGLFAQVTIEGKELLDLVKKREKKPYIILLSDKKIKKLLSQSLPIENILYSVIDRFWPGPLTIIFDTHDILPAGILDQETVAIRVPAHEGIAKMLEDIEMVFSTSANLAGKPFPHAIREVDSEIVEKVEYCIVEREENFKKLPSTIIRYNKGDKIRPITIIREGAIHKEELAKIPGLEYIAT